MTRPEVGPGRAYYPVEVRMDANRAHVDLNEPAEIGRCIGCWEPARLNDGACSACITQRGSRWIIMSARCRIDPDFALEVFRRIKDDRGRRLFLRMYGPALLVVAAGGPANDV